MAEELPNYNDAMMKKYSDDQMGILATRDYVFVIDKSTSMRRKMKKFGNRRRIQVVEEVTIDMICEAEKFDPDGLTVYTFSSGFEMEDNVTSDRAIDIFDELALSSGTVLAPVLRDIFNQYKERKRNGEHKNGMIVCVIHDGEPTDKRSVINVLVEMANYVDHDKEIGIIFVQAGDDARAIEFLRILDDDLYKKVEEGGYGAKCDIVDTKSVTWLVENGAKFGFLQALID